MKKAEMEAHRAKYASLMRKARKAEQEGLYRTAVETSLESWKHVDGMMQYERRYGDKEFTSIQGIDMILKYAPLLFDFPSLDTLQTLLKDYRRIEKNTSENLGDKLADARERMWEVHRLWDYLEMNPGTRQDGLRKALGGDQGRWRSVAEAWEKMGLLRRTPEGGSYRLALATRMGEVVPGKCPSCGHVTSAPKAMFIEALSCPECKTEGMFVLLTGEVETESKE